MTLTFDQTAGHSEFQGSARPPTEKSSTERKRDGLSKIAATREHAPRPGRGELSRMDESFLTFSDVQKTYDGKSLVVKKLNLDIARGEFLTMLGPSGSGKTTTLMMLAGFEVPTHGRILLDGRPIDKLPPHKRDIGMVFQNYALFPHMTVEENLAFPLKVRNISKGDIETKVKRTLDMVQLGSFGKRLPAQLSGGQQQRVALARALCFDPKLVLMDEPLGALDKQLRDQMQHEIRQLHQALGVTIVYVTHDQGEALTMSDRIAVFNDGIVQQLGPPSDLYEHPQNAFVARFVGDNNLLRGTLVSREGSNCSVELEGAGAIKALAVNIGAVGHPTVVALRPERVMLNPESDSLPNVFDVLVEDLIYLGDHVRIRAAIGGNTLEVKLPNSGNGERIAPGARIRIGWKAHDGRALDAH